MILVAQWSRLSGGALAIGNSPLWLAYPVAWPAFFCLAGLSFEACAQTAGKRAAAGGAARDYAIPAAMAVVVAALVLGPAVTTASAARYFGDPDFWLYFANLAGWPRFVLPGVFQVNNVVPAVNGTLWSVPILLLTFLGAIAAAPVRSKSWIVPAGLMVAATAVAALLNSANLSPLATAGFTPAEANGVPLSGAIAGELGILLALYRDRIVRDWRLAGVALAALVAAGLFGDSSWNRSIPFCILAAAASSYLAAFVATTGRHLPGAAVIDRYSRAFLFYAFPSAQLVLGSGIGAASGTLQALVAAAIAGSLSFLTWRIITAIEERGEFAIPGETRPGSGYSLRKLRRQLGMAIWPGVIALLALSFVLAVLWMTLVAFQPESGGL